MGGYVYECLAADITDERVYARALTEDQIREAAQRIADRRGEVMRAVKRDLDDDLTLDSWTVRPE